MDYYNILGVDRNASKNNLKSIQERYEDVRPGGDESKPKKLTKHTLH